MGHFQELPKLVHPDFAVPNRKPVGAVEVDHTAAIPPPDHLYGFSNAGRLLDFVGGVHSDTFAGNTRIQRNRIVFDGTTGSQVSFPDTDHAGNSSIFCDRSEFTVSTIVNFTTGNSGGIIGDYYSTSNVGCLLWVSSSGYIYFRTRCGGVLKTINGTTNIVDGKDHTIIAQYDGANIYLIVDGKQVATTTQSGNTNGGFTARLGIGSYSGVWSGNVPVGSIDHIAIWWGAPSWQAIAKNPYGYLKPSTPLLFPIPAAGGGAYTISGSSSISLTSSASFTHNIHPAIAGAANIAVSPTGLLSYNQHHIISGSVTQSITSSATMTYASGNEILGDVTLTVQPTATLDYNEHHVIAGGSAIAFSSSAAMSYVNAGAYEISGSVTVSATPSAALTYNQHPVLSADTTFYFVSAATMAYATPQEYLLSGASGIDVIPASVMSYVSILAAQYQGRRMTAKDRTRQMIATHKPRNMR